MLTLMFWLPSFTCMLRENSGTTFVITRAAPLMASASSVVRLTRSPLATPRIHDCPG
jgi:hypothetical protein